MTKTHESRRGRRTGATRCLARAKRGCGEGEPLTFLIKDPGPYRYAAGRIRPQMETIVPEEDDDR